MKRKIYINLLFIGFVLIYCTGCYHGGCESHPTIHHYNLYIHQPDTNNLITQIYYPQIHKTIIIEEPYSILSTPILNGYDPTKIEFRFQNDTIRTISIKSSPKIVYEDCARWMLEDPDLKIIETTFDSCRVNYTSLYIVTL